MTETEFRQHLAAFTAQLVGRPLDAGLDAWLNAEHGPQSPAYRTLKAGCEADVVDMQDIAGPHHSHPNGEIDLIMPIDGDATFDGRPAGWLVCPPGSAHHPTVAGGRALVLYLLPEGQIQFSR